MTALAREAARRGERRKEVLPEVWSPQLRNSRTVDIYLPASYESGRRFPVVYMQDGQNLSDPNTAFAGTWQLDAVLGTLARAGIEPIVVGVHNTDARLAEYSPFPDAKHGGGEGDRYLSFLADTLKPRVDRLFRTLVDGRLDRVLRVAPAARRVRRRGRTQPIVLVWSPGSLRFCRARTSSARLPLPRCRYGGRRGRGA
jgi:enterochelin esterase-like enzyme